MGNRKGCWIGFGIVAFLLLVVLGVGGYFVVRFVQPLRQYETQLRGLGQSYRETNEQFPFKADAQDWLNSERFLLYLGIRAALSSELAEKLAEASRVLDADKPEEVSFRDLIKAAEQLAEIPIALAETHLALLQESEISFDEYVWTTGCVHATLREGARQGDDFSRMVDDSVKKAEGDLQSMLSRKGSSKMDLERWRAASGVARHPFSKANLELIKQHRAELVMTEESFWADILIIEMSESETASKLLSRGQ